VSRNQDDADIEQAKRNAAAAKARMQTTVGALKQRLNPKTIAADAVENVKEKTGAIGERASDVARRRPVATGAAAGLAALIVFRKPVGKLVRRLFGRKAKEERRGRKDARRTDLEVRRAEKAARRDAKLRAREARQQERGVEAAAQPPDDLIPHAAAVDSAAVPAKQE